MYPRKRISQAQLKKEERIQRIADALHSGPAALTYESLLNYRKTQKDIINSDTQHKSNKTRAQTYLYAAERAIAQHEREARVKFAEENHGKEFDAEVRWFNKVSGEGMLYIPELAISAVVYACNLPGRKTWYAETACVYYERGQKVRIKLDIPAYSELFVIGITPGTLDTEAWNNIKDKPLAFRCDDEGNAINGLFA